MAADGTILINVELDESNVEKELSEFHKTVEKTSGSLSNNITSTFSAITNSVSRVMQTVADVGITVTKAVMGLSVDALKLGADLEQGIGGAEAVFDKFANTVKAKGATAFKEMGLSASDFMATANKMGALMQGSGLSIEKSMDLSTQAMQRAADVASIMGIDVNFAMESVAGAAKGNMTMMDNLGVAMNATTLEAYALSKGIETSYKEMDNAQKVTFAMEMFLEKTAYAAGNYAKENETLTGALTTAKAAMENFLSGAGDVDSLVESFTNLTSVIIDNLQELLPRLTTGLAEIVQKLSPEIPAMLSELLPAIIEGITLLSDGLVSAMPEVVKAFIEALPDLSEAGTAIFASIAKGIEESAQILIDGVSKITPEIIADIEKMLPILVETGASILEMLIKGLTDMTPELLPTAVATILTFADAIVSNLDELLAAGTEMVIALNDGLIDSLPVLLEKAPEIIQKLIDAIVKEAPKLFTASFTINTKLAKGIIDNLPEIGYAAGYIIHAVIKGVSDFIQNVVQIGEDIVTNIFNGMTGKGEWLSEKSKKFLEEFGKGLQGYAKEPGGFGRTVEDMDKKIKEAFEKSKQWMEEYQKSAHHSAEEELARWDMLARKYADYSEGKIEIDNNIARLHQQLADEEAARERQSQKEKEDSERQKAKNTKDFYDSEVLKIKDYRNQSNYLIEGEIAMWEELAVYFGEMSKERIDAETKVRELRKKLADQQAKDVSSALKSEENAIKSREKTEKDLYDNAKLWIEDYRNSTEYVAENEIAMWQEVLKNHGDVLERKIEIEKNINKLSEQMTKEKAKKEEEALKEQQKLQETLQKDLVSALKNLNNEASEVEQYHLDKSLEAVKANTDEKIKEYNREYDEKIKLVDEASQAEIKALQGKIDALNESEQSNKSYENAKKLIELNQAITKAQMGDGDLAKAQEAYNAEVKRQNDERIAEEKRTQIAIYEAQKKGVEDAAKIKTQLMEDAQEAAEKYREEETAYNQKITDLEVEIATTKNEELKRLLQEELDETIRIHKEKAALVKGDTAYFQFDKTVEQLEKQLGEARTDADKARIQKQLDEIRNFENEFFNNVTLMDRQAQNLIEQAQEEINLNKMKEIRKEHYKEMNETENLEAQARLLMVKGNEEAVISLLSEYNDDWKAKGKEHVGNMIAGMDEEFVNLTAYVNEAMKALSSGAAKVDPSKSSGISGALEKDLAEAEQYKPKYRSLGETLADTFKTGFEKIQTMLSEMMSQAATTVGGGMDSVITVVRGKNDETIEALDEYAPKWKDTGVTWMDSLLAGMDFKRLIDKAKEAMEEMNKLMGGAEEDGEYIDVEYLAKLSGERLKEELERLNLGYLENIELQTKISAARVRWGESLLKSTSLTVNFNQPVKSEAEAARALENTMKDVAAEY